MTSNPRSSRTGVQTVASDSATHGDSAIVTQCAQCGFELGTAGVVEVDMNPVGSSLLQMFERVAVSIIEGILDLQLIPEEADFFFGAGTGNYFATVNLRQLAGCISDRACASRHKDCLADLQTRNVVKAHPCRQAGHAQNPKISGRWGHCCIDDLEIRSRRNEGFSPSVYALDVGACGFAFRTNPVVSQIPADDTSSATRHEAPRSTRPRRCPCAFQLRS